jgi:universal stress protein E
MQLRPLDDHILAIADTMKPKVVVKATQYHSIAERSILVDTDWQLMRTCPYPLWFVKADEMPANPVIVAAVDPGHAHDKPAALDKEIVGSANAVAAAAGGEVHLVHTYEVLAELGAAATWALKSEKIPVDAIQTRMKDEHRELLDKLATENEIDIESAHLLPGRAHEVLPAFAREKSAGVFVMGALSRWGIKKLVIGSTAERIVNHLPCDTLIVRLGEYQLGE